MAFPFTTENAESTGRLQALVKRLSVEDFTRTTSYGWTISALLAHLAFWDQRMLVLLRRWQQNGFDPSPVDAQATNDALLPLCTSMEPRTAVELCLTSARLLDAALAALSDDQFEDIRKKAEASATQFRMNRSLHRNDHLNDMAALLE